MTSAQPDHQRFQERRRNKSFSTSSPSSSRTRQRARSNPDLKRQRLVSQETWMDRVVLGAFSLLLFILPLFFGGVAIDIHLLAKSIVFVLAAVTLIQKRAVVREVLFRGLSSKVILFCSLSLLWLIGQGFVLSQSSIPHPVLGTMDSLFDSVAARGQMLELSAFIVVFVLGVVLAKRAKMRMKLLFRFLCAGVAISLIGSAHWLVDNGKLFGVFAPNEVISMNRMRWPFVNPNHFGNYLLLIFFLALGLKNQEKERFQQALISNHKRGESLLRRVRENPRLHLPVARLAFIWITLILSGFGILGSLSRGTWFAFSMGFILYQVLMIVSRRNALNAEKKTPHGSTLSPVLHWMKRVICVGIPCIFLLLLLQDRGGELLGDRIQFALAKSGSDPRWTMFLESLPLLTQNFWYGIGAGQWEIHYLPLAGSLFGGYIPYFLHNDLLQACIEWGFLGVAPLLIIVGFIFQKFWTTSFHRRLDQAIFPTACLAGLFAIMAGAFFEFSFRIPIIPYAVALVLALLIVDLDSTSKEVLD